MKFTDEQLSRVLTAHARGGLIRCGEVGAAFPACLVQVALECEYGLNEQPPDVVADSLWFDRNYERDWSVEMFLCQLEIRGLA